MRPRCAGCGSPIPMSMGKTPRKWCSDRCRKRTGRRRVNGLTVEAIDDAVNQPAGRVAEAVGRLVATEDREPGTIPAALGELALAQAQMVDAGSVQASGLLRQTLADLAAELRPQYDDRLDELLRRLATPR